MAFSSSAEYRHHTLSKLQLSIPIEDVSKEDIRKILIKKQWLILEEPLQYPLQRINFSKKDSYEMLSHLFDENKIRLSKLGYELSKLSEYEKDCYSLIFLIDDLSKKNDDSLPIPSKNEIQNRIIEHQWATILKITDKFGTPRKLKIEAKYYDTIIPLHHINSAQLKSMYGYELNSYQIGTIWFHEFIYIDEDELVSK